MARDWNHIEAVATDIDGTLPEKIRSELASQQIHSNQLKTPLFDNLLFVVNTKAPSQVILFVFRKSLPIN